MQVYSEILGNINLSPEWKEKIESVPNVENIHLDQWMAQKSRFLGRGDKGGEYPVVLRLDLSPVLEIDLGALAKEQPETIIRHAVELGHAIGNQHWPAVVKGTKVYVPLTVDKKVMLSVMETHHIEDISFRFVQGTEVIPYLAPHEVRRLFGGAGHESHSHEHVHADLNSLHHHSHVITHDHGDGHVHTHVIDDYDGEKYPVC